MRYYLFILILFISTIAIGQIQVKGKIFSYESGEILPYSTVCIDTKDTFKGTSTHKPIYMIEAKDDGSFTINIDYFPGLNVIILPYEHVTLTIKNIVPNDGEIDLGNIYLPYRGLWMHGYRRPEGTSTRESRKLLREYRRKNKPIPENWTGFAGDFFENFDNESTIEIRYPKKEKRKQFTIKDETLMIEFDEYIK